MFAVIQLPAFPLQALFRLRPELRGEPIALLVGEGRRAMIEHVSPLATGIEPGMTAAQALAVARGRAGGRSVAAVSRLEPVAPCGTDCTRIVHRGPHGMPIRAPARANQGDAG